MSKLGSLISDVGKQLGTLGNQTVKTVVKTPADLAKTAAKQGGFEHVDIDENKQTKAEKPAPAKKTDESKSIVAHLYGKSDAKPAASPQNPEEAQPSMDAQKKAEEAQKLANLRNQLHGQYYQQLTNPVKQQEERPAEKVEREKMQDLQEKQKKDEKKKPLAVTQAQQSAEKFRGVSG